MVVVAFAWGAVRAYQLRTHLVRAQAGVEQVRRQLASGTGQLVVPASDLDRVAAEVRAAHSAAHDPVLVLAGLLPGPPRDLATVRRLTDVLSVLSTEVLPPAATAAQQLSATDLLRNGTVDVTALSELSRPVAQAASAAEKAQAMDAAIRAPGRLGQVKAGRVRLTQQVGQLVSGLRSARIATRVAPQMLGQDGPRRYLLVAQNNAEARATGGFIGAYAVIRADQGRLSLEKTGTNVDLAQRAPRPVVDMPAAFASRYDNFKSRQGFYAANFSPHFPDVATVLAALYRSQAPGRLDGVVAVDPRALSEVLAVTGPVRLRSGQVVAADNVSHFIAIDEYRVFPTDAQTPQRKALVTELSEAIVGGALRGGAPPRTLVEALSRSVQGGHLALASLHPEEQAALAGTRIAGGLPSGGGPFLQVLTQDVAGNKLDVYLHRTVSVRPLPAGQADGATSEVTVDLRLDLPAERLPTYVIGNPFDPSGPYGRDRTELTTYLGAGAQFRAVTLDGKPVRHYFGGEQGHPLVDVVIVLDPHVPRRLVLRVVQPPGELLYRQQPLLTDDTIAVEGRHRVG
jgi:Protein of unknown function (DUF4012)